VFPKIGVDMFKPAKMDFITIAVDKKKVSHLLLFLGEKKFVQLTPACLVYSQDEMNSGSGEFSQTKVKLNQVIDKINLLSPMIENDYVVSYDYQKILEFLNDTQKLEEFIENLNNIILKVEQISSKIDQYQQEIESLHDYSHELMNFENQDYDVSLLKDTRFFSYKFGYINKKDIIKLKDSLKNHLYYLQMSKEKKGYQGISIFVLKEDRDVLDSIVSSLDFYDIKLPLDYKGTMKEVLDQIEIEIWENRETLLELRTELNILLKKNKPLFVKAYFLNKYMKLMNQALELSIISDHLIYLSGWIPTYRYKEVAAHIEENYEKSDVVLTKEDAGVIKEKFPSIGKIPTMFWNNCIVKPFELLVTTYGYPGYNDVDPTPIVMVGFLLMFGMMFGDLGHGFVLAAAGAFLGFSRKFSKGIKNGGLILFSCGLSSMFFGLLFGSLFASEEVIKPLIFHPIEGENINKLLLFTIMLGVGYVSLGVFINILQDIKKKNFLEAFFGHHGIISFVFYIMVIATAILSIQYGVAFNIYLLLSIFMFMLALIVFKNKIAMIITKNKIIHQEPFIQEMFEIIELVMNYFTNTVSFVRIGAFALSHAALGIAVYQMNFVFKEMLNTGTVSSIINIASGNLLIIVMEGMVVGIQTLRLQYYEFFSKFFKGDGIEFKPLSLEE